MSEPTDEFLKVMEEVAARLLQMTPDEQQLALQLLEKELKDPSGAWYSKSQTRRLRMQKREQACTYRIGGVFPCPKAGPHEHLEAPLA